VQYNVGVLGATGAVGRQMIAELESRGFPVSELRLFATRRSEGESLPFRGRALAVQGIAAAGAAELFSGLDLVLSSAGSGPIADLAPIAVHAGAVVVDNSSAFRMDDDVPLVVPEVNPGALAGHKGIIANPNCSTIQMVVVLKPIMDAAGLKRVVVSTYQSASGIGQKGVRELEEAARRRLDARASGRAGERPGPGSSGDGQAPETRPSPGEGAQATRPSGGEKRTAGLHPRVFPADIGFNLFPLIDRMEEGCHCREELKMVGETRKILDVPELPVSATTVRVPVFIGHGLALWLETERALSRTECMKVLRGRPEILVFDEMAGEPTPTPLDVEDDEKVRVGRVREDPCNKGCVMLWAVANNLRKGAATNAVQIAEALHARGLIRR
jgi:aspartate-semialdehyde dehydrogenase